MYLKNIEGFCKISKLRISFIVCVCLLNWSCGKTKAEKIDDAILNAKILLTTRKCQEAINVLETFGRDKKHTKYLQTLASAYACKGGYSSIIFWGTNLEKIDSNKSKFLGSLTKFSTSVMTAPADAEYSNLQEAINILLYAGGIENPSADERATIFSNDEAQDINVQNLYMLISQLGKYVFYYGNANPTTGVKGTGSEANGNPNNLSNGCFYNYDPSNAVLLAAITLARANNSLGSCTTLATGHEKLPALPNKTTVTRMCQGVVLFNNLLDILSNTTIPGSGLALTTLKNSIATVCSNISGGGDICTVKAQSACETNFATVPQTDSLQLYFFFIFETLFL